LQRRNVIRVVKSHPFDQDSLLGPTPSLYSALGPLQHGVAVTALQLRGFSSVLRQFGRNLPDRCGQPVSHGARAAIGQQNRLPDKTLAIVIGISWRPAGVIAAMGMTLLLIGAVFFHRRAGDKVRDYAAALVILAASLGYLAVCTSTLVVQQH
jgi:hypothetical protein